MKYEIQGVIEIRVTMVVEAETENIAEAAAEYQLDCLYLDEDNRSYTESALAVQKKTVWVEEISEVEQ